MEEKQKKPDRSLWMILGVSVIAMCVLGAAGGGIGILLGAPFYFGFFFIFALTGLSAMFFLAARFEKQYGPDRKDR